MFSHPPPAGRLATGCGEANAIEKERNEPMVDFASRPCLVLSEGRVSGDRCETAAGGSDSRRTSLRSLTGHHREQRGSTMHKAHFRPRPIRALAVLAMTVAIGAPLVGVGTASSAAAAVPTPSNFAECPVHGYVAAHAPVNVCLVGSTAEGEFKIGSLAMTFRGPGKLQGGFNDVITTPNWVDALDGQSFTAPRQVLPIPVLTFLGNPSGVTPPSNSVVDAVASQAGPITFTLQSSTGLAATLVLPLKFHMVNRLLGNHCYLGTDSAPITLTLTTGTSGALTGTLGSLAIYDNGKIIQTAGSEVVDGLFSVPGATGCGTGGVWDSAIDAANSLPSASGSNAVTLYGGFDLALARYIAHQLGE